MIAMAPGRGGHQANGNCSPEALVAAAGRYGRTARTPVLWVDGTADSYFGPELSRAMADGFAAAGGRPTFVQPAGTGHDLFFSSGGSATWGPMIEAYLAGLGIGP
jgi:homoserine acetyltransferase